MKIEIRVSIKEGYTTIGGETVEVECDNLDSPLKVEQALKSALDLAEEKGMFRRGPAHALDLYLKMREKQIEDEVDKRHRMDKAPDPKTWELQSTITSLREENARQKCQMDGIIKGINPEYSPHADGDKDHNL